MIPRYKLEIVGGRIDWKNFTGAKREARDSKTGRMTVVNAEGKRTFAAIIDPLNSKIYFEDKLVTDPNFGQTLAELGYKVKIKPSKDPDGVPEYRLPIEIRYPDPSKSENAKFIPMIYMVSENGKQTLLEPDELRVLDGVDILSANFRIDNSTGLDRNTGEEFAKTWCNEGYFWTAKNRIAPEYGEE